MNNSINHCNEYYNQPSFTKNNIIYEQNPEFEDASDSSKKTKNETSEVFPKNNTRNTLTVPDPSILSPLRFRSLPLISDLDRYHPTNRIVESKLKFGVRMIDVGGSKEQRRMWPFCFSGLSLIVYVIDIHAFAFDQESASEIVSLFSQIINNRYLKHLPFIVILNKYDLFSHDALDFSKMESMRRLHSLEGTDRFVKKDYSDFILIESA